MEPYSSSPISATEAPRPSVQGINESLPQELILEILARLPFSESQRMSRVCTLWNRVVPLVPDPDLIMFGKQAWKDIYKFEVEGEVPPYPQNISQITRDLRRRIAGKKTPPTCSFFLMPRGLTLNKLKELVQIPEINKTKFWEEIWQKIFDEFGDVSIEKSYWILITNGVIEGSRNKSYTDQQALLAQKAGSEYQVPLLLEAAVCAFMNHAISGTYFFGKDHFNYTRCQEQIGGWQLVVGEFTCRGLIVFHNIFDDVSGVAGVRKFY